MPGQNEACRPIASEPRHKIPLRHTLVHTLLQVHRGTKRRQVFGQHADHGKCRTSRCRIDTHQVFGEGNHVWSHHESVRQPDDEVFCGSKA